MKTDTLYARLQEILSLLPDDAAPAREHLTRLSDDLAAEIRYKAASDRGVYDAAKTISKLLAACKKEHSRTQLHYAWMDDKGRQCVCDGFRAFRLLEPLPLEDRPQDVGPGIALDAITPDAGDQDYAEIPLPDAAEVRAHISLERAAKGRKHTPLWDFGPGRPLVQAQYLLDLLTVLPDARTIRHKRGGKGLLSPLHAASPTGDALLLPIRSNSPQRQARAEADHIIFDHAAQVEIRSRSSMPLEEFAQLASLLKKSA